MFVRSESGRASLCKAPKLILYVKRDDWEEEWLSSENLDFGVNSFDHNAFSVVLLE